MAGLPDGQVAGAGRVRAGGGAVLEHGPGEGGEAVPAGAHALPGAGDPGMVDVPHQPGAGVGGEPLGRVHGAGGAQRGPGGRVLLGGGRGLGARGAAPGGRAVAAPDLAPAAEPAHADHDDAGDEHVVGVDDHDGGEAVRLGPGVGDHRVQRQQPPAAQVAVPQQRPDQPADEERDQRAAEQLTAGDALRLLLGAGPVAEPPDAGRRLRAWGAQPGEERGAVRGRRRPRRVRGARWRRRYLRWSRRARHGAGLRAPRVLGTLAVHRPCP